MKKCSKCKLEFEETQFPKNNYRKGGIASWCKKCSSLHCTKWNQEHVKEAWSNNTITKHKQRGFIFHLTSSELKKFVTNIDNCFLCGEKLNWEYGRKLGDRSPTLDRMNNENFVDLNNIMIVCYKCNATKRNRTFSEFLEYCKNITIKFNVEKLCET